MKGIAAVSKVYIKLLKKSIVIPLLLLILFVVTIMYTDYNGTEDRKSSGIHADILVINRDMGSAITSSLIKYLGRYSELVISDSDISYLDYLSTIQYDYIIDIPENYQKHFMEGKYLSINFTGTGNGKQLPLKNLLNTYLRIAMNMLSDNQNITVADLTQKLDKALNTEAVVILEKEDLQYQNNLFLNKYIKGAAYLLILIMFFVIGRISSYYRESGIRKRHDIAPMTTLNNELKLLKDNIFFVIVCNLLLGLIMFLIKPDIIMEWNLIVYFINFLLYSFCILGLCYVITALSFRYEINVILILLLTAFMALLNRDAGLNISNLQDIAVFSAEFTPVYWLKKVNDEINGLISFNWSSTRKILELMGMNILLATAYFSVALVINKKKGESE